MRSRQIKSSNTLYPSAVNNRLVEAKEYNELQADVADLYDAPTVSGARDTLEEALKNLLTALASKGIIIDETTET